MGKVYLKCLEKRTAKAALEFGVSSRNPVHLLCFLQSYCATWYDFDPGNIRNGLYQVQAKEAFFSILAHLRELEAQQLGYASEAARVYAEAQGKAPKNGETVSIYA
jgi:hypothetical protein